MEQRPELVVHDVPEESRYEIREGDRVLGIAAYSRRGDVTEFVHTEVFPDSGRSKVGSTLVRAALEDVRAAGGRAIATCPFVKGWIARHPEYEDLLVRADA